MSIDLVSVEDILGEHPLLTRAIIRDELGAPQYIHRAGGRKKYSHKPNEPKGTTVFYKSELVLGYLGSARFTHLCEQWEAEHKPWFEMANAVSLSLRPEILLDEKILPLRKLTKQIRRGGWFEQWLSNEVRHQLSNYDEVCKEFPEEVVQFVRPILHTRISSMAEGVVPCADDLVTVFQSAGDSPRWMFAPVHEGLQEFTSFK